MLRKPRALSLVPLIAVTYFMVAGGPYGLEDLIAKAGYRGALWALIATPLIWSLPTALMVAELSAAMPEAGGYYVWVRRALGPFWGFQEAWLSLAASIFDMAIYPTLLVLYLGKLFPVLAKGLPSLAVGAAIIAASAWWNMRGAKAVGDSSLLMGLILLTPFAVMVVLSAAQPARAPPAPSEAGLLAGILVAMWNYMGWDHASTVAPEVKRPERTYPLGLCATVALVAVTYILPVWAARRAGIDPRDWSTGSWVSAGEAIGGRWLGTAIVICAVLGAAGAFSSLVMAYSRIPVALAERAELPRVFARRDPRTGAPRVAIAACSVAYAACLGLGFERLIFLDVLLYGVSLVLEFVALVVLRIREPNMPRPFRIPGALFGALVVGALPTALLAAAVISSIRQGVSRLELILAAVILNAGAVIYWARRRLADSRSTRA